MSKRMKTGVPGFDRVLEGGFLYHNSILMRGAPGSGKTTLGIQMIHNGATQFEEPGLVVLFEQFPQQLYRDLKSYGWDLEDLEQQGRAAVLFAQPEEIISQSYQLSDSPLVSRIVEAADLIGARRILVDGFSNVLRMLEQQRSERETFLRFINAIKSIGLTPILTTEGDENQASPGFEEYLADCVIHLSRAATVDPTFQLRWLEVRKTRGHGHVRGRHPYRIDERGLEVFPHLPPAPQEAPGGAVAEFDKVSSGVQGLDSMMGGGFVKGSSSAIAGMPGVFKTTLGCQFLAAGAQAGEKGLLIILNEAPEFVVRAMKSKGIDLASAITEGRLQIWHRYPKEFYPDELMLSLERELDNGLQRVVIDGVNEVERGIENPAMYEDFITGFTSLLGRREATSLFVQNMERFTASAPLTDVRYADIFDGIVYLGAIEIESAMHKVISVLKMRGSDYVSDLREIVCGKDGLFVKEKFFGMSGILAGNAQGHYKQTVEEIFQPLNFITDFIPMLATQDLDASQRAEVAANLNEVMAGLKERLEEYFGVAAEADQSDAS